MYEDQNVKYLRAKDMIKQLAKDGHDKNIKVCCTNCYLRNTVNYHWGLYGIVTVLTNQAVSPSMRTSAFGFSVVIIILENIVK